MTGTVHDGGDPGMAAAAVAERVARSVVMVRSGRAGGGAGVIWRPDGLVATNHHVAPGDRASVVVPDGRELDATIVARDPANDLAMLKVAAVGLPAAAIGDARTLRVGELVLAIGHPFGIRHAVTLGLVHTLVQRESERQGRELVRADVLLGPGTPAVRWRMPAGGSWGSTQ
jgi:serine protease Do